MVCAQSRPGAPAPSATERAHASDAPASSENGCLPGVQFQLGFLRDSATAWQPSWSGAPGLGHAAGSERDRDTSLDAALCESAPSEAELPQGQDGGVTGAGGERHHSDACAPAGAALPLFHGADGLAPSCSAAALTLYSSLMLLGGQCGMGNPLVLAASVSRRAAASAQAHRFLACRLALRLTLGLGICSSAYVALHELKHQGA